MMSGPESSFSPTPQGALEDVAPYSWFPLETKGLTLCTTMSASHWLGPLESSSGTRLWMWARGKAAPVGQSNIQEKGQL